MYRQLVWLSDFAGLSEKFHRANQRGTHGDESNQAKASMLENADLRCAPDQLPSLSLIAHVKPPCSHKCCLNSSLPLPKARFKKAMTVMMRIGNSQSARQRWNC